MADEEQEPVVPEEDWLAEETFDGRAGDTGLSVQGEDPTHVAPPTPHAVKLDAWGKRKGKELAESEDFKPLNLPGEDVADIYGMAFEPEPQLLEHCSNPAKLEFLSALQENPEYQGVHNDTCLDVLASEIASISYGEQLSKFVKEREKQQAKDKSSGKDPSPKEQLKREMEALGAADKAAREAAQEVQDLRNAQESMGVGKEDGGGGQVNRQQMKKMFQRLKNDQQLKNICELAGRYRMLARAKQRDKITHGYDDMIGIVLGGDLSRILPSELALLNHPLLRLDAQRRLVESQMMCKEYRGIEKVAKGPIMIGIDESGSMSGPKIENAKAMALAMAWVAKHQGRWCGMFGWSSRHQIRMIALPPKNWPSGGLLEWLGGFLNGGTHIPIEKMPEIYTQLGAVKGKTDIIIITDGEAEQHSSDALAKFKHWKEEVTAKVIGISIAANSNALKAVSDDYYQISSLSVKDEAVGKALSV